MWYSEYIVSLIQVTDILNNMLMKMVSDGDIVDVKSGEALNIVSHFYLEEHLEK